MKPKPITLTYRDKMLLEDLQQYALLSTKHLSNRHFPGVQLSTIMRRLRMLEAKDFIQRIPGLEQTGFAWGLSKAGAKFLAPTPAKTHFPRFIQEHDIKLSLLRMKLEEAGIARAWCPEHEIRAKVANRSTEEKEKTIPDGLMAIETNSFREVLAVELELTHKNQDRYHRIFRDYASKENLWGFWYVVGHTSIGNQLMTAVSTYYRFTNRLNFFWSPLDEVMSDPLKATIHSPTDSCQLNKIFTPVVLTTAQQGAHPLGTFEEENDELELELSDENETQITEEAES